MLIYNTIPTSNNASADVVIGQATFATRVANQGGSPGANTLWRPHPVYADGTRLFISDRSNNRILVYNTIPTFNNASADAVIGQPNFILNSVNQGGSIGANTIFLLNHLFSDGSNLIASDDSNHRVLIYNLNPISTTLASSIYDAGSEQEWGPISWTASTPSYTSLAVEVSTNSGVTWTAVTNGQSYIGKGQTMQYRVTLSNTDGISSPTFSDITIDYETNAPPAAFTLSTPDNQLISSSGSPSLAWNASSDGESGLNKYQLYFDGELNTDNISSTSTAVIPSRLTCGGHSWFMRALDRAGNSTDSNSQNLTVNCSGGLPPGAYDLPKPPDPTEENKEGKFKVIINNGEETTDNRTAVLKLFAGDNVKRMTISNAIDFSSAEQEDYAPTKTWTLTEGEGVKTVYIKFFTEFGQPSETVSSSIVLKTIQPFSPETKSSENSQSSPIEAQPIATSPAINASDQSSALNPPVITLNLRLGMKHIQVIILQEKLKQLNLFPKEVNLGSLFDLITFKAVKDYQESQGIFPNGIFGPRTRKALNGEEFITNKDYEFVQDLKFGDKNEEVRQLQTRLRDRNFYPYNYPSTGYFGPITQNAVDIFKKFYNLIQNGIVDKWMRDVLNIDSSR